jgi:excisionase family DNA binding protein
VPGGFATRRDVRIVIVDEPFLTVAQVAETLQLNQQNVRNWVDRGELPAVRVGKRRVRVRREDLDA